MKIRSMGKKSRILENFWMWVKRKLLTHTVTSLSNACLPLGLKQDDGRVWYQWNKCVKVRAFSQCILSDPHTALHIYITGAKSVILQKPPLTIWRKYGLYFVKHWRHKNVVTRNYILVPSDQMHQKETLTCLHLCSLVQYFERWMGVEQWNLYAFKCKRFRNTRHTVPFGTSYNAIFETPCITSASHIES
jgi:hypothetical protein